MSQSGRLNAPSSVQARRMATISACAVGSLLDVTSFQPSAMIVSLRTMTAPNGHFPALLRFCSLFSLRPSELIQGFSMQDPNLSQVSLRFFNVVLYDVQLFPDCKLASM